MRRVVRVKWVQRALPPAARRARHVDGALLSSASLVLPAAIRAGGLSKASSERAPSLGSALCQTLCVRRAGCSPSVVASSPAARLLCPGIAPFAAAQPRGCRAAERHARLRSESRLHAASARSVAVQLSPPLDERWPPVGFHFLRRLRVFDSIAGRTRVKNRDGDYAAFLVVSAALRYVFSVFTALTRFVERLGLAESQGPTAPGDRARPSGSSALR